MQKVDAVHSDDSTRIAQEVKTIIPNLFKDLGELEGEFSIKFDAWLNPLCDNNTETCSTTSHAEGQGRVAENGKTWRHFKS